MSRIFKLEILESIETLKSLLKEEKNIRKRERLQFLFLYKSGQAKTRQALGTLLNRSHFAIGQWADTYRAKGLHGLLHLSYRGGNLAPSIPVEIQWRLKERLAQPEGFASYKATQIWLKETHGLDVPLSTVHGTVKYRLKAGPKVLRPHAEHHDPEAVEDFKKTVPDSLEQISTPCLKRYSNIRYWTQDESRFGLKTIARRRITLKGVKPVVKVQRPFDALYLYGVVEPLTGEMMIEDYRRVNAENLQQFLDDFSERYPKTFMLFKRATRAFIARKVW